MKIVKSYLLLAMTIAGVTAPAIAQDFTTAGLSAAPRYILLVGSVCSALLLGYEQTLKPTGQAIARKLRG